MNLEMDRQTVINAAKACARALRRWRKHATTENEGKWHAANVRVERLVENLEWTEKLLKERVVEKGNVVQSGRQR